MEYLTIKLETEYWHGRPLTKLDYRKQKGRR